MRCDRCLVPGDVPCRGELLGNERCHSSRHRRLYGALAGAWEGRTEDASPAALLFASANACPHREAVPDEEREGCDCAWKCTAGHGREPDGRTDVVHCWDCPIAPRRASEAETPDAD